MDKEIKETENEKTLADLIVESQMYKDKALVLAEMALRISQVLKYYADSKLPKTLFTIVDEETKEPYYKVVEVVNSNDPYKEHLIDMKLCDIKYDAQPAKDAYNEIFRIFDEIGVRMNDEYNVEDKEVEDTSNDEK